LIVCKQIFTHTVSIQIMQAYYGIQYIYICIIYIYICGTPPSETYLFDIFIRWLGQKEVTLHTC
jgi:hypothetical protein